MLVLSKKGAILSPFEFVEVLNYKLQMVKLQVMNSLQTPSQKKIIIAKGV